MTYEATVQFKFDATYTHDYNRGFASHLGDDDFLPEEHFLITAPAADLNCKQYFKLFEKFMLCVGMCPSSIRSGAMSLVFNDMVKVEDQRKVCKEYELTMDEDLQDKYEEWKIRDAEVERLMNSKKGPMGTVPDNMPPWGHSDMEALGNTPGTPGSYRKLYQENLHLKAKISRLENPDAPQYTDEEIEAMCSEESGMD